MQGTPQIGGFLIDLDGTIVEGNALIPGASEALVYLREREIPFRLVTNTTSKPRAAILEKLGGLGLVLQPDEIFTAPVIARDYLIKHKLLRCYALLRPALWEDLAGIELVCESPQAVIVGDMGEQFSYEALNRGFRFLLGGAAFVSLANNRYFKGSDGLCLDVGAFVAALEYGSDQKATLIGKPSLNFFNLARQSLGVAAENTVVIGDDLEADVAGAQAAGCVGVLVKTGKFRQAQFEKASIVPHQILNSLASLPDLLKESLR